MITFDYVWSSATSTGGQTAVLLDAGCDADSWRVFARSSTVTATTVAVQIAESTAGPWVSIASTSISTGVSIAMDFSGPLFGYVRAYSGSTGATIRLVGVS